MPEIPEPLAVYIEGLRSHDIAMIGSSFSPATVFVTPVKTMGPGEILEFLTALYRGFPDWSYAYDEAEVDFRGDGMIGVKWRQGGTHTATLEFPGFPGVPATGRRVTIPEHYFYYRVENGALTEIRPVPVPGGAPRGIFEQIGVELPPL
jgi:hypothetical protein